jgi:hypothetical protein
MTSDALSFAFYLVPTIPVTAQGCERQSVTNMPSTNQSKSQGDASNNCLPILAATGIRKTAKGHWKYRSAGSFVQCSDHAWSNLGLKAFKATNKAGVEQWLRWIVEHCPKGMD